VGLAVALLYLAAVAVLAVGGWRTATGRNPHGAGYFGAAFALLAYSLPAIAAGL
jgi:TRAP-type C4-dicarboxylate transport system permease small subunit